MACDVEEVVPGGVACMNITVNPILDPGIEWEFHCPHGWDIIGHWGYGYSLRQSKGALRVFIDCTVKEDGAYWLHVSVSRKSWTPTHEDMALVKQAFIGDERYAYSVWPPLDKYVNIHKHCLHLWAKMDSTDGRVLPEFSSHVEGIGRSI